MSAVAHVNLYNAGLGDTVRKAREFSVYYIRNRDKRGAGYASACGATRAPSSSALAASRITRFALTIHLVAELSELTRLACAPSGLSPLGAPFSGTPRATPFNGSHCHRRILIAAVPVWHRVPLTSRPAQPHAPRE